MKIIHTCIVVIFLFIFSGCQTIENKSQSAIKKENEQFVPRYMNVTGG